MKMICLIFIYFFKDVECIQFCPTCFWHGLLSRNLKQAVKTSRLMPYDDSNPHSNVGKDTAL
jgi:hypothetical protein